MRSFSGLANQRQNVVRLTVDNARAAGVKVNGVALPEQASDAAFEAAASGWRNRGPNLIEAKSASLAVTTNKVFEFSLLATPPVSSAQFVCDNGFTEPGESIYVSGNTPALGNSDPTKAIRLAPNVYYEYIWNPPPSPGGPGPSKPVWTGVIQQLPPATTFQWRCLRKLENGTGSPQLGPLQTFATGSGGYAGRTSGAM